jgi:predicted nucleotidyltransferase
MIHSEILRHRDAIAALCLRHGVIRLEVFGSAARGEDFDPARSDVDRLVAFGPQIRRGFGTLLAFEDAASSLLHRRVDRVEREAIEESRNPIRKKRILGEAQPLYPP